MKNEGDFYILVDEHFKALGLDGKQRQAAMDILSDAAAIVEENGQSRISVRAFADYILFRLNELGELAEKLQSLDDLRNYEFLAREHLKELTIIIGNISHLIARGHKLDELDDVEKTLDEFLGDMRDMFEHLVKAHKLFVNFARASKENKN
jgi:NTP pyrophosphatase (non-canonical NTP hydrolase)